MTSQSGFENTLVFAENADFSGGGVLGRPALTKGLQTNGQLWIGTTALNVGNTHINVGNITSPLGTITVGYVSPNITIDLVGGTVGADSFLTDSGAPAVVPNGSGEVQILGGPGVTVTGQGPGNVITVNSVVFTNTGATTMAVDNGYFATAAGTYNLPATAAQGELIHIVADTAGAVVVDAPALNFIRLGSALSSSGGTATSTAQGDSLTMRYRASTLTWHVTASVGIWVIA